MYNYLEKYLKINRSEINEAPGTTFAFLRRFRKIKKDCNFLVSSITNDKINIMEKIINSSLTVIDVHSLPEKA